jgi:hypothetical protein
MLKKKRYLAGGLLLLVVTLLVVGSVSRLAQQRSATSSPYAALFRPDALDCPTLCWHGLRVGETSFEDAQKIIAADPTFTNVERPYEHMITWQSATELGFSAAAIRAYDEDRVAFISFTIGNLTARDAIAIWGTPIGQWLLLCGGADSDHGEVKIFFKGNMRINVSGLGLFNYLHATDSPEIRLHADDHVDFIRFFSPLDNLTSSVNLLKWEGFRGWNQEAAGRTSMCGM